MSDSINTEFDSAIDCFSENARAFDKYYTTMIDFKDRVWIWRQLIDQYATSGDYAVDMGCGTGIFSFYMAEKGLQVVGIDAAVKMIDLCEHQRLERSLENLYFQRAELPMLKGVELEQSNLIVCSSVLEYIEPFEETLALFSRLLEEQGILIISLPNASSIYRRYQRWKFRLWQQPKIFKYIKNVVSPKQLESCLQPFGLKMLELHYYAHDTRVSRLFRWLRFSPKYTENLFVAVFRKSN